MSIQARKRMHSSRNKNKREDERYGYAGKATQPGFNPLWAGTGSDNPYFSMGIGMIPVMGPLINMLTASTSKQKALDNFIKNGGQYWDSTPAHPLRGSGSFSPQNTAALNTDRKAFDATSSRREKALQFKKAGGTPFNPLMDVGVNGLAAIASYLGAVGLDAIAPATNLAIAGAEAAPIIASTAATVAPPIASTAATAAPSIVNAATPSIVNAAAPSLINAAATAAPPLLDAAGNVVVQGLPYAQAAMTPAHAGTMFAELGPRAAIGSNAYASATTATVDRLIDAGRGAPRMAAEWTGKEAIDVLTGGPEKWFTSLTNGIGRSSTATPASEAYSLASKTLKAGAKGAKRFKKYQDLQEEEEDRYNRSRRRYL